MLNRVVVVAGVLAGVGAATWAQSSFTLIEPAPGFNGSHVTGISGDGGAAAGRSTLSAGPTLSFVWTREGGRFDYGNNPGVSLSARSTGISGDGLTVVGVEDGSSSIFRWSGAGGYQPITGMAGHQDTFASAISGDGSVITGYGTNGGGATPPTGRAFRWTQAGGYQDLGTLPGGGERVVANAMSRDGNVIVGTNDRTVLGPLYAFRWTPQGGMQPLQPAVNSPFFESDGRGVSGDGLVAIGNGAVGTTAHPFRWTAEGGMVDLGVPFGVSASGTALCSNYDGTVISCSFNLLNDYIWLLGSGYTRADDYFRAAGITLPSGYSALDITGISDDGRAFVGAMTIAGVGRRGFVAVVPAPSCAAILIAGIAVAGRRRRC